MIFIILLKFHQDPHNETEEGFKLYAEEILVHPDLDARTRFDFCLVKVKNEIKLDGYKTASIRNRSTLFFL